MLHIGKLLSRFVGWYNQSFFFSHPVTAVACAGVAYTPAAVHNPNGELIEYRAHMGLVVADVTAGEEEEAEERSLVIIAASQFLYPGVRLLGRYTGEATVGEGEEADTREVYVVSTCTGCLFAADYYERPNNEEPGDAWSEDVGDAHIDTGRLVTADADARFWYWSEIPKRDGAGSLVPYAGDITVKVSATQAAAQALILAARRGADHDYYWLLVWEFGASDGKLLFRRTEDDSATEEIPGFYFTNEGSEVVFAGQGVEHETTIRVCWGEPGINVYIHRHDDRVWAGQACPSHGLNVFFDESAGFGLGTRDVPGGLVRFNDFEARHGYNPQTNDSHDQRGCPTCQKCHGCADDQDLCLKVDGEVWVMQRRGPQVDQWEFISQAGCGWQSEAFDDEEGADWQWQVFFYLQDNGLWLLWIVESRPGPTLTPIGRRFYGYLLGIDAPHCDEWHCLRLSDFAETGFAVVGPLPQQIDPETIEGVPLADATISSGNDCAYTCYGYDEADCCEETEMPETLYIIYYVEDVPASSELEITYTEAPDGWTYDGRVACFRDNPPFGFPGTGPYACCIPGESDGDQYIPLTIHSCEPFHATGCRIAASDGREWCVEIYE